MGADYMILIKNPKFRNTMLFAMDRFGGPYDMQSRRHDRLMKHYGWTRRTAPSKAWGRINRAMTRDTEKSLRIQKRNRRYFTPTWSVYLEECSEPVFQPVETFCLGECSFLKAALCKDVDSYIPDVIQQFSALIPYPKTFFTIDDKLIEACKNMKVKGHDYYSTQGVNTLVAFLEKYKNQEAYTELW